MGLASEYVKDIWKQRSITAVYPPGESVQLGDVYRYDDGVLKFFSTLKSRGVRVKPDPHTGHLETWDCKSSGTSKIVTKVEGKTPSGVVTQVLGKADAGAIVQFSSERAFILGMSNITIRKIANLETIARHLRDWFWSNDWDTSFVVVTEVWTAGHATVLTSGSHDTQVELRASGKVKQASLTAADLSAGFKVVNAGSTTDHLVGEKLTPLFRGYRYVPFRGTVPAGRSGGLLSLRVTDEVVRANFDPSRMDFGPMLKTRDEEPMQHLVPFTPDS